MSDQSTYPPASRGLPVSDALAEAQPLSLQELFSRDPENFSTQNIDDIIRHQRELRSRMESTGGVRAAAARVKKSNENISMDGLFDNDLC